MSNEKKMDDEQLKNKSFDFNTSLEEFLSVAFLVPLEDPNENTCIWGLPVMLHGSPGIGKCLGLGTQVLLYNGKQIAVEDVKAGDLLMGPDSKPRKVLGTTTGTGPMFKIIPTKGDPWVCNDVHVLTLVASHTSKVIDIPLDEYLRKPASFKVEHKQFFTDVDFVGNDSLPIDPYFMGVWYGDGHKADRNSDGDIRSVRVSKPDAEIAALMQDTAKAWDLQVTFSKDENKCPTYTLSSGQGAGLPRSRNSLLHAMREIIGDCSSIPRQYMTASRSDRQSFLAGILDTDGSYEFGCYDIVQKRRGIADGICFIARSLGIRAVLSEKSVNNESYWRITLSGDMMKLPLRISRKMPKPRKQIKDVSRTGIRVEALGEGQYAGFTLDGDGRFLLGDFTVTHNTARIRQASTAVGLQCRPVELGGRQPEDASGAPFLTKDDRLVVACILGAVNELNAIGSGVLFLDELTCARPATQGAFLSCVQERRVGDVPFARRIRVVCAGNPPHESAGGYMLQPPMANRMAHRDVRCPTIDEFMEYLIQGPNKDLQPILNGEQVVRSHWIKEWPTTVGLVHGYLKRFGEKALFEMPRQGHPSRGKAFPTPRMVEDAARAVNTARILGKDTSVQAEFVAACLGNGSAVNWETWIAESDLPDPEDVLKNGWEIDKTRLDRTAAVYSGMMAYVLSRPKKEERMALAPLAWTRLNALLEAQIPDQAISPATMLVKAGFSSGASKEIADAARPIMLRFGKKGLHKYVIEAP